MGYGSPPMVTRASIPVLDPVSLEVILEFHFELEQEAVKKYSEILELLEGSPEFTSLRIDLEDVLSQEQEHTHDLIQWLNLWNKQ